MRKGRTVFIVALIALAVVKVVPMIPIQVEHSIKPIHVEIDTSIRMEHDIDEMFDEDPGGELLTAPCPPDLLPVVGNSPVIEEEEPEEEDLLLLYSPDPQPPEPIVLPPADSAALLKPWISAIVSLAVTGASLIIILRRKGDESEKKWAFASVGTILGYWLG